MKDHNVIVDFQSYEVRGNNWIMKFKSETEKWSWKKFKMVGVTEEYSVWGSVTDTGLSGKGVTLASDIHFSVTLPVLTTY